MSKGKQFLDILKKYGVTEYWCDEDFDINEEHPFVNILIPSSDTNLIMEVTFLYNDYDNEDTCLAHVSGMDKSNHLFKRMSSRLQRRIVNAPV